MIPAYNEEMLVGTVVRKVRELYGAAAPRGFRADVIVIDDGSTDKTAERARAAGAAAVISHPVNRGLGAATRTGLREARAMGAEVAVKIDADDQHDPEDIRRVVEPILQGSADAVFGSRLMGELQYAMPAYRALGNRLLSALMSGLTGLRITDSQTGLMAFHRRYLRVFEMISDYNETQQLIIDCWSKRFRVIEVPIATRERRAGKSFISLRYPFKVLPTILRMMARKRPSARSEEPD